MSFFAVILGFSLIWHIWWLAFAGLAGAKRRCVCDMPGELILRTWSRSQRFPRTNDSMKRRYRYERGGGYPPRGST